MQSYTDRETCNYKVRTLRGTKERLKKSGAKHSSQGNWKNMKYAQTR